MHWELNWMLLLNIFCSRKEGPRKDKNMDQYLSMYMLDRSKKLRDVTKPKSEK